MNVFPDFDGLGGIGLRVLVGAVLTFVLIVAVLVLIVSAIVWIATARGNYSTAGKSRTGVLVALGAAVLAGGGVAWMTWLINLGQQL